MKDGQTAQPNVILRLFHMGSECQKVVNDFFEKMEAVVIEPIFDKAMNVYVLQRQRILLNVCLFPGRVAYSRYMAG